MTPSPDPRAVQDPAPEALPLARRLALSRELGALSLFFRRRRGRDRLPMVSWMDPGMLFDTGLKTLFSIMVGERSDPRLVQALAAGTPEVYDYTRHHVDTEEGPEPAADRPRRDLWIDYVCDTGDGWNSTYGIAWAVAQPTLTLPDGTVLPRGDVLVFGGDEVYPTPTREEYDRRLVRPYSDAFGDDEPAESPHVFAIPGNHDWYDGLNAFSRIFRSGVGGRWFAGWWTRQRRSYFALKLPHRWWLLGMDGQLKGDLDTPQIEYFQHVATQCMQPGDRAIVCLSQPVWIYAHKYRAIGSEFDVTDLIYLRDQVLAPRGIEVPLLLSGDFHHYRRHEEAAPPGREPQQQITAGGGGAFLHPTHDEDVSVLDEETSSGATRRFLLKAAYPDLRTSNRLTWRNLAFLFLNPKFGIVPAVLYLLTAWLVRAALGDQPPSGILRGVKEMSQAFQHYPALTLWVLLLVLVFVTFTKSHSIIYRTLGGLGHLLAHWAAIFLLSVGAARVSALLPPQFITSRFAIESVLIFVGGWVVGSFVMGLYLFISLNVFGRHSEEAFSSLKIEDYKHFLRMHLADDGSLTIHPIKLERVPRRWRDRGAGDATPSRVVPVDPLVVERIEPPVVVGGRNG